MNRISSSGRAAARWLCLLLAAALLSGAVSCASSKVQAEDLMEGLSPAGISGKTPDEAFIGAMADFSIGLFQKAGKPDGNTLISPLSVMLALAMTANGAAGRTLTQMETVLGGAIPLGELNRYLYSYTNSLPSDKSAKLDIANSIWFRGDAGRLTVRREFLQTNADYYAAAAYKAAFDGTTLDDINHWVKTRTDGLIDKILDRISDDTVMYLINAMVFDAKWQTAYNRSNVSEGTFTAYDGIDRNVVMMRSEEAVYLESADASGFIKPYAGGHYAFAAILPDDGTDIISFISSLSGSGWTDLLGSASDTAVAATLPKFSVEDKITMNGALEAMGMTDAFDSGAADLSRLGSSTRGNLFINEVLHKTFIQVDELGTKAGAVTKVEVNDEAYVETKTVTLDRPFLYAVIDTETDLPLFLGAVLTLG